MPHSLVVDTDPGVDDAMALLYLAGRDDVGLRAITTVYGNTTVDLAFSNAARVLALAGIERTEVALGAAHGLDGTADIARAVHGGDGLGDLWSDRPQPANPSAHSSAELLVELGRTEPGEHTLVALGPLTNLALALELDPDVFTRYRAVYVMGGSGGFTTPGVARWTDANVQNDGEAARRVFAAPRRRMVSVGVDVTSRAILDEADHERLRTAGTPVATFCAEVLEAYADFYRYAWGRRISPAHDGITVALAIEPTWATEVATGPVNVLSNGYATRAQLMRLPDGSAPAVPTTPVPDSEVVVEADFQAFHDDFLRILAQP